MTLLLRGIHFSEKGPFDGYARKKKLLLWRDELFLGSTLETSFI